MGSALAGALAASGWEVDLVGGRGPHVAATADGAALLVLCVPDGAVADVAATVQPNPVGGAVVAHCAGALTLDVLAPHARRASLHPLVAVPRGSAGPAALRGAWMALAGDPLVEALASALGAQTFRVADEHRVAYHASAAIAANHLVALLGQAERVAGGAGVPAEAIMALAQGALAGAARVGATEALTGPVARGDWGTIAAHLAALAPDERSTYEALALQALRLAWPTIWAATDEGSAPPWRS